MQRRISAAIVLLVLVLASAACAPIAGTPPGLSGTQSKAAPPTAATSVLSTPAVASSPAATGTGKLFRGTARHAGQPVPGARVELRELGWATNRTPAVAVAEADAQGAFSFVNPPAGAFSVIGVFPDGEMDAGGWPPINIAPGQAITGFIVPMERRLTLLSPIAGTTASASPVLRWRLSEEATHYRVWVIDAGTTAMVLDQSTAGDSLAVTMSLEPGVYQWVVNGLNAGGEIVAMAEETFTVGG